MTTKTQRQILPEWVPQKTFRTKNNEPWFAKVIGNRYLHENDVEPSPCQNGDIVMIIGKYDNGLYVFNTADFRTGTALKSGIAPIADSFDMATWDGVWPTKDEAK